MVLVAWEQVGYIGCSLYFFFFVHKRIKCVTMIKVRFRPFDKSNKSIYRFSMLFISGATEIEMDKDRGSFFLGPEDESFAIVKI